MVLIFAVMTMSPAYALTPPGKCATYWLQAQTGKYIADGPRDYTDLPCDSTPVGPPLNPQVGDEWDWYIWSLNGPPTATLMPCTVRGSSTHVNIVVENSQWNLNINQTDVNLILEHFENSSVGSFPTQGIWELNTSAFGLPPDHLDQDGKIYILYYDFDVSSDGFFWAFDQACDGSQAYASNECDVIYMNCSDSAPSGDYLTAVVAHEFQHLIHYEQDPNEAAWVDEGCGELAMWLYGHPDNISSFNGHPDRSLTTFDGSWADYIKGYLWMLYFYEQFGGISSVYDLVHEPANSIAGFENFLIDHGYAIPFTSVFANWTVANFLDDPTLSAGQYGYLGDELPVFATSAEHDTYPVTDGANVNQWATDYVRFTDGTSLDIAFHGNDASQYAVLAIELDSVNETRVSGMTLDGNQDGNIALPDLGTTYAEAVMVFAGLATSGTNAYTYMAEEFTAPTATPVPTATPNQGDTPAVTLLLNQETYTGGDEFILDVEYWNPYTSDLHVQVYIVLDVYGSYWFWPTWVYIDDGIDSDDVSLPAGAVSGSNILTFAWPDNAGQGNNICFLAAILDYDTFALYGDISQACFAFN